MNKRRTVFRASAKFYVIITIVAAAIAGAWFCMVSGRTAVATDGTVQFTTVVPAVVVRDEEVIASESYGKADYLVPDQQRVEADTAVVEVYKWGYNEKVMDDLVDVRTKILLYEESSLDDSEADLAALDAEIEEKTRLIRAVDDATQDATALESELRELMARRARYLQERASSDQQLVDYRKQEQQLEERVGSWRDVWRAGNAGVVSYYFD